MLTLLAFACISFGCEMVGKNTKQEKPSLNLEALQGIWSFSHDHYEIDSLNVSELSLESDEPNLHREPFQLRFIGDSLEVFAYPLEFYGAFSFQLDNGRFSARNAEKLWNEGEIRMEDDSLLLTVSLQGYKVHSHFFRDSLNVEILSQLVRDSVNRRKLIGEWELDTIVSVDYDESFILELPFQIPQKLSFSEKDIIGMDGRIMQVMVNSTLRPFRFGYGNKHRIWLKPVAWYSEGLPPIEFQRTYFISLLEDIGINDVNEIKEMEIRKASNIYVLLDQGEGSSSTKSTSKRSEIEAITELLQQLNFLGTGKEYRNRADNLVSWRIRLIDKENLWHNVLIIGDKIETNVGAPGEYYSDPQNIAVETQLLAKLKAFME